MHGYHNKNKRNKLARPAHATEITVELSFVSIVIIQPTEWTEIAAKLHCATHTLIAYLNQINPYTSHAYMNETLYTPLTSLSLTEEL